MRRALASMLLLCLAATVIAGCASNVGVEQQGSIPSGPAAPEQPRESPSEARLDHAIDVRTLLGMRADRPFVEALFSDFAAVERGLASAYGIPLTGLELERLETIKHEQDATIAAVERYAATVPEAYAGLWIDTITHEVVANFKRPIDSHANALEPLLSTNAPLRLVEVEWSHDELERFRERVWSDVDWLAQVDATFLALGVDEVANRVDLEVQSTRPDIVDIIRAHFGGSPMLTIQVDPRAPWTGGRGTLVVIVEHEDGPFVRNYDCSLVPDDPAAWGEDIRTTGDVGRCEFRNVGATGVRVVLTRDGVVVAGEKTTVIQDETVTVRIVLHKKP